MQVCERSQGYHGRSCTPLVGSAPRLGAWFSETAQRCAPHTPCALDAAVTPHILPPLACLSCCAAQGAFGGDFGELAAGIAAYFKATNLKPSDAAVADIFNAFVTAVASPARPFYFHSRCAHGRRLQRSRDAAATTACMCFSHTH
jgi:hypothetical protein